MGSTESDREIITRVLNGDLQAYGILYDRYSRYVCGVVSKCVPNQAVDEIVLAAFHSAYKSLQRFSDTGEFRHWIATIARRRCCDYWRSRGRERELSVSNLDDAEKTWVNAVLSGQAQERFTDQEEQLHCKKIVHWALGQLSAEDKLAVILVHLEGKSNEEAAEILGWTIPQLKMRVWRARRQLQKNLEKLTAKEEAE